MHHDVNEYISFRRSPRRLREFEEEQHTLLGVRCEDGQCIAKFPNGEFALPLDLRAELAPLVGREIAILRLDGYHVREIAGSGDRID